MPVLCVRIRVTDRDRIEGLTETVKRRAIQAIGGVVEPQGNPVTFWIATEQSLEEVRLLPDVEDAIRCG